MNFEQAKTKVYGENKPNKKHIINLLGRFIFIVSVGGTLITYSVFFTGKNLPDFFSKDDLKSEDKASNVQVDVQIDTPINIHMPDTHTPAVHLVMSETAYKEELQNAIESDQKVYSSFYNDFRGDGNCEMFALVVAKELENNYRVYRESVISAEIWFVNQDGARKIESEKTYWPASALLSIGNVKFLPCEEHHGVTDIIYLWGVNENGEPYQPNISGKGNGISINEEGEIVMARFDCDSAYLSSFGHYSGYTWTQYYFYWNDISFNEYGGKRVSVDELYAVYNINELIDKAISELYNEYNYDIVNIVEDEIFYRQNGIINVNFECRRNDSLEDYYNHNLTLRRVNGTVEIVPGEFGLCGRGKYKSSFIPSMASLPTSSFSDLFG